MNDTVLSQSALKCLIDNLGIVQTERFISLIIKEPFNYTEWQKDLYSDMSPDEFFSAVSEWKESTVTQ